MSGKTIRLVPGRMMSLRNALRKESERLQAAADQVARVTANLDMDLKAKAGISSSIEQLRRSLKQQAENLTIMARLAEEAEAGLAQKDEDLAGEASELLYTMKQMLNHAGAAQVAVGAQSATFGLKNGVASLQQHAQLDATSSMGSLFGGFDSGSVGNGVSLESLGTGKLTDGAFSLKETIGSSEVLIGAGVGAAAGIGGLGLAGMLGGGSGGGRISQTSSVSKKKKKKNIFQRFGDSVEEKWNDAKEGAGKLWKDTKNAASDLWEDTKDVASDIWDGTKEIASDIWDGTKEVASDIWDGTKELASDAWDGAKNVWNGVKTVAQSKPVEYIWEIGGSVVGGIADVGSFCGHVATGNFVKAGTDVYSFVNNFFDGSQDLVALTIYGMGSGVEAFGGNAEMVQRFYDGAEEFSNRDGLAGELRASGLEGVADALDVVDTGVGIYKFGSGIKGLADGTLLKPGENPLDKFRKNLFEFSGWKLAENPADIYQHVPTVLEKIEYFDDLASNYDLAYKYVDGALDGKTIETILENTQIGKLYDGATDIYEDIKEYKEAIFGK